MGSSDKFCLRWNDFETNISEAFRDIRNDADFFDVTLVSEDDRQIQAHKVILSACSPFFRRVLKRNPHSNPLLYLKGTRYSDLVCILNFMYHGEVNVAQDELNTFLGVAEELNVKGLTPNNGQESYQSFSPSRRSRPQGQSAPKRAKRNMEGKDIKMEQPTTSEDVGEDALEQIVGEGDDYDDYDDETSFNEAATEEYGGEDGDQHSGDLARKRPRPRTSEGGKKGEGEVDMHKILNTFKGDLKKHLVKEGSNYFCALCEYTSYKNQTVLNHIDAIHSDCSYNCPMCDKEGINSLSGLRAHYDRVHLGKKPSRKRPRPQN